MVLVFFDVPSILSKSKYSFFFTLRGDVLKPPTGSVLEVLVRHAGIPGNPGILQPLVEIDQLSSDD